MWVLGEKRVEAPQGLVNRPRRKRKRVGKGKEILAATPGESALQKRLFRN